MMHDVQLPLCWQIGNIITHVHRPQFLWASEEINRNPAEYWTLVMDIAIKNNLKRIIRCSQIMGRNETDELAAAQIFYPVMQCADIFFLRADICQLGMDQRKVRRTLTRRVRGGLCGRPS